jgi:ABC-type nitrate/sulfonate/bicarbonate transport system substrate-binding protein
MTTFLKRNLAALGVILLVLLIVVVYNRAHVAKESNNEVARVLPKIKIGYKLTNLDAIPQVLAHEKGYFKEQGVDAELIVLEGSDAPTAVVSGQVDVVIAGAPRFYGPIEKGAPVKIIAPTSNTPSELFVRPNSGINTFKDLEGKRISFGTGGSTNELLLRYVLTKENVDLEKVKFLNMDNQYLHSMLMEKKSLDAIFITDAGFADAAKKLGAVVMPGWMNNNYEKNNTAAIVVAINTDYLNSNEAAVRGFFKATIEADRYLKSNLNDSAAIITKYYRDKTNGVVEIKPEEFAGFITDGKLSYPLWDDPTLVVEMARISGELGLTKRILTSEELYDLRFKDILEPAQYEIYGPTTN